jgi:hypothetical protein
MHAYSADTAEHSQFLSLLCELRRLVQVNFFWNPLWDPIRDLVTTPVSEGDIRRLQEAVERIAELASRLSEIRSGGRSEPGRSSNSDGEPNLQ